MATWTKTNNIITLTQDTTMSELVNDSDIPLVDADIIQLKGHNLIVDIITCGSADPDFTDEVNMGVTVKNDGGGECNLEFKDLSGIRLNATLPGTVHPCVDPDNPLPVFTKDPRKVIHGDPYCTKLTANARVEIQLAGNFSLGGGSASLPTETREGKFYAKIKTITSNTEIEFDDNIDLHKNDYLINYYLWDSNTCKVSSYNSTTKIAILSSALRYTYTNKYCASYGGGILVYRISNGGNAIINADINFGALSILGTNTKKENNNFLSFSNCKVIGNRLNCMSYIDSDVTNNHDRQGYFCQSANLNVKNVVAWYLVPYGPHSNSRYFADSCIFIENAIFYAFFNTDANHNYQYAYNNIHIKIKNLITNFLAQGQIYSGILEIENVNVWDTNSQLVSKGDFQTPGKFALLYYGQAHFRLKDLYNAIVEEPGILSLVEKNNVKNIWHHMPSNTYNTTWKYSDHLISPKSILRLKVRRMVESASSASEARVAITDTANWYPQTKYGALSELVMNNLETDRWHTFNLQYKNPTDEPLQVRVWECVSGSTDGGYLKVEEATGGPM